MAEAHSSHGPELMQERLPFVVLVYMLEIYQVSPLDPTPCLAKLRR